jgi:hypothetical protein
MIELSEQDADRLELLDRLAERVPKLDLDQYSIEWDTLSDGHAVLHVGCDTSFANYGEELHALCPLDRILPGLWGLIIINADGSWRIARAVPPPAPPH